MKTCPRCKRNCLEDQDVMNAISHLDNKTHICSVCGQMEGYIGFFNKGFPAPEIPQYEFLMHEIFAKSLEKKKK